MSKLTIALIIITVVMIAVIVALYFLGKRAEKQQAEQQEQIAAAAQQITMLVIDKKKCKMSEAGFPDMVVQNASKRARRSKIPVVKAKVGPRVMSFMCDPEIFETVPVRKEIKATVSGIYISAVRGIRGPLDTPQKKKGLLARLRNR